jgi:threonine dehydratase
MGYAISVSDITAAADRINGIAVRTPLIESPLLNERMGGRIFVKAENLQHSGAFKFRGAYNRLSQFTEDQKKAGVLAFSSGNHSQGIALAARMLGIKATIVMPKDAPKLKVEGTRGYGAEVVFYDRYTEVREEVAARVAGDSGVVLVPPYNDPAIMAGQGTIGLEIAQDLRALGLTPDQTLMNCGGGGLSSGVFTALCDVFPKMAAYAVEPEDYDDVKRSLECGKILEVDFGARSICDALLTPSAGSLTFPILRDLGVEGLTISDDEARAGVAYAAKTLKQVGEPGGVASFAAVLAGKVKTKDKVTVCIISGGNIDPSMLVECLAL